MIFISIMVSLVLDRLFNQFQTFRQFHWLQEYFDWMDDVISVSKMPSWGSVAVLLTPLLVGVWLLQSIFANGLFGLFELAFNVIVLFLCFGPQDLDQQVDDYILALDSGDSQKRFEIGSAISEKAVDMDLTTQLEQVVNGIFTSAHRRIFACVFWFVLLGPIGAAIYRLTEQSIKFNFRDKASELDSKGPIKLSISNTFVELLAYMEWLSARITVAAFMLSGHFEAAFSGYRKAANDLVDIDETNQGILTSSGIGAIQYQTTSGEQDAVQYVKKARGLVLRSLVVWLLICLFISWV